MNLFMVNCLTVESISYSVVSTILSMVDFMVPAAFAFGLNWA